MKAPNLRGANAVGAGVVHQQRALPEIVEQKGGKGQTEPGQFNGPTAEVSQVGVERLASRDAEHHGP